jgi:hypothetical protein
MGIRSMARKAIGLPWHLWTHGMPLWHRHLFWLWFVLLMAVGITVWALVPQLQYWEVLAAMFAACWGVVYFLRQQHLEEARFFRELFTEFNRRYDRLNETLLQSLNDERPFDEQKFVDYFNLCAEEWLYYKAGYVYELVWQAWHRGMRQFGRDSRVAELWRRERQTESYYGFEFPIGIAPQEERKE